MSASEGAEPSSIPVVGDVVGGKYQLEATLGRGGMGIVFAARHAISQRPVALKWLDPDLHRCHLARERFLREAEAMGRIEHPNVVTVLDVSTSEHGSFLVMELLRGESMRLFLQRVGRLPAREAVELLLPVVSGVEAAHRAEVVHRDLKPDNLFVTHAEPPDRPAVRILDFGVAKLDGRSSRILRSRSTPSPTQTGQQLGTPRYMAPEQVVGGRTDERTDVWGLGSILYELITGRPPFDADVEARLFVEIATFAPKPIDQLAPDVPPALASLVARSLAKNPDERPPSAKALGHALAQSMGVRFREPSMISSPCLPVISDIEELSETSRAKPVEPSASVIVTRPSGDDLEVIASVPPAPDHGDATTVDRSGRHRRLDAARARPRARVALYAALAIVVLFLVLTGAALATAGS